MGGERLDSARHWLEYVTMGRGKVLAATFIALAIGVLMIAHLSRHARALPPAGIDVVDISAEVNVASRLGQEDITMSGSATIVRSEPRVEDGRQVVDLEITAIDLHGQSVTGPVSISASATIPSTGEFRSVDGPDNFPASSFFDIFITVTAPASPDQHITLHNDVPLHLVPMINGNTITIGEWPPTGVPYRSDPIAPAGSHCEPPNGPGGLPLLPSQPAEVCLRSAEIITHMATTPTRSPTACPPDICVPTFTPLPTDTPEFTPTRTPTSQPTATPMPTVPPCSPAAASASRFSRPAAPPLSIPDDTPSGVDDCIEVVDGRTISDLNVAVNVHHSYLGDLQVTLEHESTGTTVTLVDRPGVPDTSLGCPYEDIDAVLDDEARRPVEDECAQTPPGIAGTLRPEETLSAFDGESVSGRWTLNVSDNAGEDVGSLASWSLVLNTPTVLVEPGDANCDGRVNAIDSTLILQFSGALLTSLECQQEADVNHDTSVNSLDAALILQYVAGLLTHLPP